MNKYKDLLMTIGKLIAGITVGILFFVFIYYGIIYQIKTIHERNVIEIIIPLLFDILVFYVFYSIFLYLKGRREAN